jgi:hypothetical protein
MGDWDPLTPPRGDIDRFVCNEDWVWSGGGLDGRARLNGDWLPNDLIKLNGDTDLLPPSGDWAPSLLGRMPAGEQSPEVATPLPCIEESVWRLDRELFGVTD